MEVNILAFGIAREIMGKQNLVLEIPNQSTVKELLEIIEMQFPKLKDLASMTIAINEEYVKEEREIKAMDEIAIIPPVSGG
ncbi:molybdopterin converting factor subunit 1 [Flexithrix dorotheae]|uniref:molybdopterin converting factor subunit 1 n=1 Tax=Flexithrix dorotheae TaxID=70993 RepID=UPI000475CEF5|nr:molybdopterin converting factor subunit 1 [Flexithrix dorotheae]